MPDSRLHDAVRIYIYRQFIETGRAIGAGDIARALNCHAAEIEQALVDLADAHTIVLAPGTRSIWMAHPFTQFRRRTRSIAAEFRTGRIARGMRSGLRQCCKEIRSACASVPTAISGSTYP